MIVLIATYATPHVPRGELHQSHMRIGGLLDIFNATIPLLKRPYVINAISFANQKSRFTKEKYFPREGEKFLSRGRKNEP
jgi:hypothetical protein